MSKSAIIGIIILLIVAAAFYIYTTKEESPRSLSGEQAEKTEAPESALELAQKIFKRQSSPTSSGSQTVKMDIDDLVINYNYFPTGLASFEKELGIELSPKIKKFYEKNSSANKIILVVYGPFNDNYGNTTFKPIVSFDITRTTYYKINWDNFLNTSLISVADRVEWFRRID